MDNMVVVAWDIGELDKVVLGRDIEVVLGKGRDKKVV